MTHASNIVDGSRSGGNTEALTRFALEEADKEGLETKLVILAGKVLESCDIFRAFKSGDCRVENDFESIYGKVVGLWYHPHHPSLFRLCRAIDSQFHQ